MTTKCPKCGFSHAWDGTTCGHCNPPPGAEPAPPAEVVRVPLLDRALAVVLFAAVGAVAFGLLALLIVGWEALKSVVVAAVLGGEGGMDSSAGYIVLACIGIGLAGGAVAGWQTTGPSRPRLRQRPDRH